jgi:N-acetylglucosamine kinase-like BadF-type ATPase
MHQTHTILIADSGSTKTDWALLRENEVKEQFASTGFNPYFADTAFIIADVRAHMPPGLDTEQVTAVHFYGSGCFDDKIPVITDAMKALFPKASVSVALDLLGTARALLGDKPGFAAILGTGTNTCLYDGKKITMNIDSLGYTMGDEGSGTHLGKKLLGDFIRESMPVDTRTAFLERYPLDKEKIFEQVYGQPFPNRFLASFAPFLLERMEGGDPYAVELVKGSFREFFGNLVSRYPHYKDLSFNCVGSIGHYFKAPLLEVANEFGMASGRVLRTPIDGLVEFHSSQIQ